jgi:acyl-coenzyme A thioesterase 9
MDSLAGNVVFTHIDDNDPATRPPNAVTASADNIRQFKKLRLDQKTFLHGRVTYVGTSSIVVRCDLKNERGDVLMGADFVFAARSNATGKATPVNPLDVEALTEEQKVTFDEVKAQIELKKNRKMDKMPMREEVRVLRKQWVKKMREMSRVAKEMPSRAVLDEKLSKTVLTSQTMHENLFVAQPQQVNLSGRIFGGFLLRRGFELALANAYTFAGTFPLFVNMSDVDFRAPVEVGDLLRFRAHIIHVGEPDEFNKETIELKETNVYESGDDIERDIVMQVEAIVVNPKTVNAIVTNSFLITFRVKGGLLPTVLPESTDEAFGVFEKVIRPKLCGWD